MKGKKSQKTQVFTVLLWDIFKIEIISEFTWVPIIDQKQEMNWNP